MFRQNQTREQKDADAQRKSIKRAAEKKEKEDLARKRLAQTSEDWIYSLISVLAYDAPKKTEQRKAHAECEAKRKASESVDQKQARCQKEAKAQALKRSLESKSQHRARLDRERKCQIAKYYDPNVPDEYFDQKLSLQRVRQQKLRDTETPEQRQIRNAKKAEYQSQVREEESQAEFIARLNADRDQHYKKMASDREVIKAVNNRKRIDDGTFLVASFENETEEKIYATWEKRQLNL